MKISQQVASQGLCEKLKELGVIQDKSAFDWYCQVGGIVVDREFAGKWIVRPASERDCGFGRRVAAFSVAELGLIFPDYTSCEVHDIAYAGQGKEREYRFSDGIISARWERKIYEMVSEADARAKFAIFSLENGLIPVSSVNERMGAV